MRLRTSRTPHSPWATAPALARRAARTHIVKREAPPTHLHFTHALKSPTYIISRFHTMYKEALNFHSSDCRLNYLRTGSLQLHRRES
jgi:hypothetical protein